MIKTHTLLWSEGNWEVMPSAREADAASCQLVFAFGSREAIGRPGSFEELRSKFPTSRIVLASTAGEIVGSQVLDNTIVATGLAFEHTSVLCAAANIKDYPSSRECGTELMSSLPIKDLRAALVFSDGGLVNGSGLTEGLNQANLLGVPITGGLAGDGLLFGRTLCGLDGSVGEGNVVVVGLYGQELEVGHGSCGGWVEFGQERFVSYSEANVLYTIDGRSALSLYKEHLGADAADLPGSALLFPLSLRTPGTSKMLVRAITSLDEAKESMSFAGNMPVGARVRLMNTTCAMLVDAADTAARSSRESLGKRDPEFALLISCVGRRMVMKEKTGEELAAVRKILGPSTCITGFYSYGEVSPCAPKSPCDLHNQTMTITTLSEG
jgi:hypothetical protein